MNTENKTILITGANRGIGRAVVEEALRRGAKRVYAATRQAMVHSDERVTPVTLDVTNSQQLQRAVENVGSFDILINNAGVTLFDDLSDRAAIERLHAVNLFGIYWRNPGLPAFVDRFSRSHRQHSVDVGLGRGSVQSRVFDLEGGRIHPDAIAARALGRTECEGSWLPRRYRGHRHVPRSPNTEGLSGIRRARHFRSN